MTYSAQQGKLLPDERDTSRLSFFLFLFLFLPLAICSIERIDIVWRVGNQQPRACVTFRSPSLSIDLFWRSFFFCAISHLFDAPRVLQVLARHSPDDGPHAWPLLADHLAFRRPRIDQRPLGCFHHLPFVRQTGLLRLECRRGEQGRPAGRVTGLTKIATPAALFCVCAKQSTIETGSISMTIGQEYVDALPPMGPDRRRSAGRNIGPPHSRRVPIAALPVPPARHGHQQGRYTAQRDYHFNQTNDDRRRRNWLIKHAIYS